MQEQIVFKRNMGLFMAVMIGIGGTMGPGIFSLQGELAHMIGPLGIFLYWDNFWEAADCGKTKTLVNK